MSVVFKNPGEGLTPTKYTDPAIVAELGNNIMTVANGRPPHTAITWDSFDETLFPHGSDSRSWVESHAETIDQEIKDIHDAGMLAMYWFDMFVLPRALVSKYGDQITTDDGKWSFDSALMTNITEYMLDAVFERFPGLDGLLIRTGEIYTQDVPYHEGSSPIANGSESHIQLLDVLVASVVDKHDKLLFYRTWSLDGFHTDLSYYLEVTDAIEPRDKLFFVIKHTKGDFWRTTGYNPTINIGKHPFLVGIQCQREYEGKGAYPNYIMDGVINGFEEDLEDPGYHGLNDFKESVLFRGLVIWPRGGGWLGPYPADEFWIDMNVQVISKWAMDPFRSEETLFKEYARDLGYWPTDDLMSAFRDVALLSARGVLLGHYSLKHQLDRLLWTRDWYIGGGDKELRTDFENILNADEVSAVIEEKAEAGRIWDRLLQKTEDLTLAMKTPGKEGKQLRASLHFSVRYGQLLYRLIESSWEVSLLGMSGNATGTYDVNRIQDAISEYDRSLSEYNALENRNCSWVISSLYTPFGWGDESGPSDTTRSNKTVDMWR